MLKIHLAGKAQTVFQHLLAAARDDYKEATKVLSECFEPLSHQTCYKAKFQTQQKQNSENCADFADCLKTLVDKGYPELQEEARE